MPSLAPSLLQPQQFSSIALGSRITQKACEIPTAGFQLQSSQFSRPGAEAKNFILTSHSGCCCWSKQPHFENHWFTQLEPVPHRTSQLLLSTVTVSSICHTCHQREKPVPLHHSSQLLTCATSRCTLVGWMTHNKVLDGWWVSISNSHYFLPRKNFEPFCFKTVPSGSNKWQTGARNI